MNFLVKSRVCEPNFKEVFAENSEPFIMTVNVQPWKEVASSPRNPKIVYTVIGTGVKGGVIKPNELLQKPRNIHQEKSMWWNYEAFQLMLLAMSNNTYWVVASKTTVTPFMCNYKE